MPNSFIEPNGHKKPYRLGQFYASGYIYPLNRRMAYVATYGIFVGTCILTDGVHKVGLIWILLVGIPISWSYLAFLDWMRRRSDPAASKLARSDEGRALLNEGDALHRRRERLMEDRDSPFPLLVEQVAKNGIDATTAETCADAYAGAWESQLRLERELRERQDRFCP